MSDKMKNKDLSVTILRSRARELLFSRENYITVILALIVCGASLTLPYMLLALIEEFVKGYAAFAFFALLEIFTAGPMLLGAVKLACSFRSDNGAMLADVFFAFSSIRIYLKSLMIVICQLLKLALELGGGLLAVFAVTSIPFGGALKTWMTVFAAIFGYWIVRMLLSRFYGVLYFVLSDEEMRIFQAVKRSFKICKSKMLVTTRFRFSTLPLVLISAIPLGIPLLLYTIPYKLCGYSYYIDLLEKLYSDNSSETLLSEDKASELDRENNERQEENNENGDINNEQH